MIAARNMRPAVLPIRGEGLTLCANDRHLLDHVDIELMAGSGITVVAGPNGAGKSLLLRVLSGLLKPTHGRITWGGLPPDCARVSSVGFVLQRPVLLRRSALANIEYALGVSGVPRYERRARAGEALSSAGLSHVASRPAPSLSGGEQQRLALARALVFKPQCLLLDEPTANLDQRSIEAFEEQLLAAKSQATPILLVSHDAAQIRRLADHVLVLHHGRILEDETSRRFLDGPTSNETGAAINGRRTL